MSNNPVSMIDLDGGWDGQGEYDNAMVEIRERNKNDFLMQSLLSSGSSITDGNLSRNDRNLLQQLTGSTYTAQFANRFNEIASVGGGYATPEGTYNITNGELTLTNTTSQIAKAPQ